MARFQGNVHAGSDRASATILFLVLLVALLMAAWWSLDPAGFNLFWTNFGHSLPGNQR